jgi:hypothetical protein
MRKFRTVMNLSLNYHTFLVNLVARVGTETTVVEGMKLKEKLKTKN